MVVAVAKALEGGATSAVCASTGNTSASAAAYCAVAGIACNVVVPEGKVALGKLAQAVAHGARIVVLRGNFDDALTRVREIAARTAIALLNSVNPHRIEGQKTAAFEVANRSGALPDVSRCRWETPATSAPAGAASASSGGRSRAGDARLPGQRRGARSSRGEPIPARRPSPPPSASATRRPGRRRWPRRQESGGLFRRRHRRGDPRPRTAGLPRGWRLLRARQRGAGGGAPAPLARERDFRGQTIVAVLTGHGLKDPQSAIDAAPVIGPPVENDAAALEAALR